MAAPNASSSSMIRTLAVIKGFVENGYEVDLFCIHANSNIVLKDLSGYGFMEHVNIIYADEEKNGGANQAVYGMLSGSKGGIKHKLFKIARKLYHYTTLYDFTHDIAKKVSIEKLPSKEYEYVMSDSDPKTSHIAMAKLVEQGLTYKKWIQYWGDPLVGDISASKTIYTKKAIKREEKKLFSKADKIVYTSPFTLKEEQRIQPEFANKMIFVPTPFIETKIHSETKNNIFTVGYYGDYFSNNRDIMPLYNACNGMKNELILNVMGKADFALEKTDNINVFPRGDISELEKKTDLYICVLNKKGTQIPGKLYHYAATNRPVLVLVDGDNKEAMIEYIAGFDRYLWCNNKENDIIQKIRALMAENQIWEPCEKLSCRKISAEIIS